MSSNNPYDSDADPYDYDYQPFERTPITSGNINNVSGTMNTGGLPPPPPPPPTTTQMQSKLSTSLSPTQKQQPMDEDLRLKAMELARREAELDRRERELSDLANTYQIPPKKNWPICKPFLYHNISGEIPAGIRRRAAYMGYFGWMVFSLVLVANFAGSLLTSFSKVNNSNTSGIERVIEKVEFMLFAGLYVLIGIPIHFILSYWPLYQAMRTVKIGRFTLFFIGYAIPVVFCAFCIGGWYTYGSCGIYVAILYFPTSGNGNVAAFVYNIVMACIWGVMLLYFLIIYIMAIRVFRYEKHTLAKARDHARSSIMSTVASSAIGSIFGGGGGATGGVNTAE
jgi:hypothetical protein